MQLLPGGDFILNLWHYYLKNCFHFIMKMNICLSADVFILHFQSPAFDVSSRLEIIAQEDKTKLLKAAFLQYCRYFVFETFCCF